MRTRSDSGAGKRLARFSLVLGLVAAVALWSGASTAHAAPAAMIAINSCDATTLNNAIATANAASGDTISFGCSGDIKLTQTLTIKTNLTLNGGGRSVTLDGGYSTAILGSGMRVLVVNSGAQLTLTGITVANGLATAVTGGGGGGGGGLLNGGTVTISDSTFTGNFGTTGAALWNDGGTLTISNSTFAGNNASRSGYGGGLYIQGGTVTISNSTFTDNSAGQVGGGLYVSGGTVTVGGSIVAGNNGLNCAGGKVTDEGYNLESATDCGFTGTNHSLNNTDPKLASALANNGGPTQTIALLTGSPAIDAIPTSYTPSGSSTPLCPKTDQRGYLRPDEAESLCDMGAYESGAVPPDSDLALTNVKNITTDANSPQGAIVNYALPTVVDEDNPLPTVTCTPGPGSTFAIGTTTVNCTVTDSDDSNSPVQASFTVTVDKASPTLTTTASPSAPVIGAALSDSATLAGGDSPGGTITFYLFAPGVTPNSSDSNNVFADTVAVTGDNTYSAASGTSSGSSVATALDTYQWVAVYSGDANNNSTATSFGDEPVTVNKASPSLATTASPATATVGATLKDSATLSGGYNPTGTITFTLTDSHDKAVDTETATVSGNGTYTTNGYTATSADTYQWQAAYSGDTNNNSYATTVGDEPVTVNKASTTSGLAVTSPTQPGGLAAGIAVSVAGQAVTFTATISPSPDGGTVTFTDGATTLCGNVAPSSGKATCTTTYTAAGQHSITATYSGDGNYVGSAASLTLYVNTSLSGFPTLANGAYNLQNGSLSGASLVNANLGGADGTNVNLSGANLTGANLSGANLTNAKLTNANLTNANLTKANFNNANLKGANLTGANLSGATGLGSANLSGAIWSKTTCPDSTVSDQDGGTCAGHL